MSATDLIDYPFEFIDRASRNAARDMGQTPAARTPVAIIGGGIAGLTAALALSAHGIACTVLEADRTVCFGSRAVCFSRRSLEILQRYGVAGEIMKQALPWTAGRSFYRNTEVLHFNMPHDDNQQFAPMVNLAQYSLEEILVQQLEARPELVDLRFGCRVATLDQGNESIRLGVEDDHGARHLDCDWLLACDGGRSFVRERLGLSLKGTSYEGRYVVVDIKLQSERPTERLAWFDPPSNPGSTILMHRQPNDIWRVDYQLPDGQDEREAVKPENVMPLLEAHLKMIGERAEFSPIWISLYKANALSLEHYRHGRVLFLGDAAHLVPIFGVRGANSTIDDADNLAWKLAAVIRGQADEALLDSYSSERRHAAEQNLESGMKSTEFMAPPGFAFRAMRAAVLNLAVDHPQVRSLINPRQSSAISYLDSTLNARSSDDRAFVSGPRAGETLHSYPVEQITSDGARAAMYLCDVARPGRFALLRFGNHIDRPIDLAAFSAAYPVDVIDVFDPTTPVLPKRTGLMDLTGRAHAGYDVRTGASYLVRPDGHVLGRWRDLDAGLLAGAVADALYGVSTQAAA
jgi:3-(3-hydroxy-phenyl)propionate hydroxylase